MPSRLHGTCAHGYLTLGVITLGTLLRLEVGMTRPPRNVVLIAPMRPCPWLMSPKSEEVTIYHVFLVTINRGLPSICYADRLPGRPG